jgi:dihydrofolate reductase
MLISLIVAMDQNRGIGKDNRIPWRLSADLKHFKTLTMGHHLIVGRKTAESIGRPLPGRAGVLITHAEHFILPGWETVHSLEAALTFARQHDETEAFIGGGAAIYTESLPLAHRIYLTRVHTTVEADTFFSEFEESDWEVIETWDHLADEKNEFAFTYQVLIRSDK